MLRDKLWRLKLAWNFLNMSLVIFEKKCHELFEWPLMYIEFGTINKLKRKINITKGAISNKFGQNLNNLEHYDNISQKQTVGISIKKRLCQLFPSEAISHFCGRHLHYFLRQTLKKRKDQITCFITRLLLNEW